VGPIKRVKLELAREARGYRGNPWYVGTSLRRSTISRRVLRETPD
jgi:hypothetical protein